MEEKEEKTGRKESGQEAQAGDPAPQKGPADPEHPLHHPAGGGSTDQSHHRVAAHHENRRGRTAAPPPGSGPPAAGRRSLSRERAAPLPKRSEHSYLSPAFFAAVDGRQVVQAGQAKAPQKHIRRPERHRPAGIH